MAPIPRPTIDAIYQTFVDAEARQPQRDYLGGSQIGEECERKLWYSFRHVLRQNFDGRILRLFDTGHREEARLIEDLRRAGCTVYDRDAGGSQFRYTACDGHFSGGLDGVIEGLQEAPGTNHLLEAKTMKSKLFDEMDAKGVAKAKPVYFAQLQVYMHMAELTRAAFFAVCKDDDRIYMERVPYDAAVAQALLSKASRIIHAETPPDRIAKDASSWLCKFCPYIDLCHGAKVAAVNCRTCVHSSPVADAQWECAKSADTSIPEKDCTEHIFIPDLIPFATPVTGEPEWIEYVMKDGRHFINCAGAGFPTSAMDRGVTMLTSSEIEAIDMAAIGNEAVEQARKILGGKVVKK